MGTFITSERRDAVALVTIDNPPMNALSAALLDELEREIETLDADASVRAIVQRIARPSRHAADVRRRRPVVERLGAAVDGLEEVH